MHTVSENVFKKQINFLSLFGKFVSLDDIRNYDSLSKINFAISFDDVSKSILNIKPYLQAKLIPYAIAPNTSITENGFGKRSISSDFRKTRRGAKGVIAMQTSERNGKLIGAAQVSDEDQVMLITNKGMLVRTKVSEINVIGRNTQGVTVIKLKEGENLISLAPVREEFIDEK